MESHTTTIRLPVKLIEQLKRLAEDDDRSLNAYIRLVLINHVKEKGK